MTVTATMTDPVLDQAEFKAALRAFPTGVTVMTTVGPGGAPIGVTANSFNSVSMDPPLILWSLGLGAGSLPAFRDHGAFAVNILAAGQEGLCRTFASRVEDRFASVDWAPGHRGVPVIAGSAAVIECAMWRRYEGGDHEILLGEAVRVQSSGRAPLVFGLGHLGPFETGL